MRLLWMGIEIKRFPYRQRNRRESAEQIVIIARWEFRTPRGVESCFSIMLGLFQ